MNFKPFQDLNEKDVINLFALNTATGAKGTPVVINTTGGWNNSQSLVMQTAALNGNPSNTRYASSRWAVSATVRAAVTGEKPFAVQLWDVKESTQFGEATIYHPQWCAENQCVPSGNVVPVARQGLFLVGPFPAGDTQPNSSRYAAVKGTGDWGVVDVVSGVVPSGAFGRFLGGRDADGYALVDVNCR